MNKMVRVSVVMWISIVVALPALAQRSVPFDPGCQLPFEEIKSHRWIDDYCGIEGSAGSAAGKAQNRAKNNFCVTGPATDLTLDDFRALQRAADDAGIHRNPRGLPSPRWRSKLQGIWTAADGTRLGEGDLVRFVGYLDKVFHAAVGSGESVNCKLRGATDNDIHVELGESRHAQQCDRLITEISPHFRPASWTVQRLLRVKRRARPVRITGQLFWDASHSPCGPGEPAQWRATIWEIHPIYQIEVCTSGDLDRCRAGGEELWVPLHSWSTE